VLLRVGLDPKTDGRVLAQVAVAWEKLEERKRILRMTPKPKDLDTTKVKKARPESLAGPVEVPPEDWIERLKGQTPKEPPQGTPGNQSPGTTGGELAGEEQGISFG